MRIMMVIFWLLLVCMLVFSHKEENRTFFKPSNARNVNEAKKEKKKKIEVNNKRKRNNEKL